MCGERKGKSVELSICAYNFISNRLSIHKRYTDMQLLPKNPPRYEKIGMVYGVEAGGKGERRRNKMSIDGCVLGEKANLHTRHSTILHTHTTQENIDCQMVSFRLLYTWHHISAHERCRYVKTGLSLAITIYVKSKTNFKIIFLFLIEYQLCLV